jgi:hypothetical protein
MVDRKEIMDTNVRQGYLSGKGKPITSANEYVTAGVE